MFFEKQEAAIINLVLENNEVREIQSHIINDHTIFSNIRQVSLSTLAHLLQLHYNGCGGNIP